MQPLQLTYLLTYFLARSLARSLAHSLTHSLTHSQCHVETQLQIIQNLTVHFCQILVEEAFANSHQVDCDPPM